MISTSIPVASVPIGSQPVLLRRDLIALLPYLNRKEFEAKPGWEQAKQVESALQRLAAASRMQ
jgi:hypothetical protein